MNIRNVEQPLSFIKKSKQEPLIIGEQDDFLDCEIDQEGRSQHTHVIGATNSGKSRFLLSQIIQDIKAGRGVCVIDPHDELIDHIRDWLAKNELLAKRRKVRLLDLNDQEYSFGFNPLSVDDDRKINATVDQAVNAMASVMGGEDLTQTPLLRMSLYAICIALASARLTLEEAQYLVNPRHRTERLAITETITNPVWKRVWDSFNDMAERHPKMYMEYFQAAERRFIPFIGDENVRSILGQNENTLDLKKSMDDGEIILVNVSRTGGFVASESSQIIARLLINNLIAKAYTRTPRTSRPFNLFIDEVQNYLSGDIPEILSQCRKFGLYLTLAHQYLHQLKDAGDLIYAGVMGTARNKVVFSVDDPADAEILAKRVFAGMTQYELPKKSMIRPTVVGHQIIELQSRSFSQSESENEAFAVAQAKSVSHAKSESQTESEQFTRTVGETLATTVTDSETTSSSHSESQSSGSNSNSGHSANSGSSENASSGMTMSGVSSVGESAAMMMDADGALSTASMGSSGGTALGQASTSAIGGAATSSAGSTASSGISSQTGSSATTGTSHGRSVSESQALSSSESFGTGSATSYGETHGVGETVSHGQSRGTSRSQGRTDGISQSLLPIMEMVPTALYSLQEQQQMFMDAILLLPTRTAFVTRPGEDMVKITTLDTPDIVVSELKKKRVIAELKSSSAIHKTRKEVAQEIAQRYENLVGTNNLTDQADPMNPDE